MRSRLIAGIFSIALVLLVVVGPLYLAEKLENIETAQNGLIATDQLLSEENLTLNGYTPYLEMNSTTAQPYYYDSTWYDYGIFFYESGFYDITSVSFNNDGYIDTSYCSSSVGNGAFLYFYMRCDFSDMYENDITEYYFNMNLADVYLLQTVQFRGMDEDGTIGTAYDVSIPAPYQVQNAGDRTFELEFTTTDLLAGISACDGYEFGVIASTISLPVGYTSSNVIYSDIEVNPEYYESYSTTYDNVTVTTYEPYIQTITPYSVHKVMMGIGGVLIFIVALIVSPLPIGEKFDKIFPVTNRRFRK